jgi:diguanylate cyclase (GGDEF)-like protein
MILGYKGDAFERFAQFVLKYDAYNLDDLALSLTVVGFMSLIYSAMRVRDLRQEIAKRNRAEEATRWIASHGAMTGLLNRHQLKTLSDLLSSSNNKPQSVFSIDLAGLKEVNDLIGHHAGDTVLKAVAEKVRTLVGQDNLFRVGGDEFVALSNTVSPAKVHELAKSMAALISDPMNIEGREVEIGASIGYAFFPEDGATLQDVVGCSDIGSCPRAWCSWVS